MCAYYILAYQYSLSLFLLEQFPATAVLICIQIFCSKGMSPFLCLTGHKIVPVGHTKWSNRIKKKSKTHESSTHFSHKSPWTVPGSLMRDGSWCNFPRYVDLTSSNSSMLFLWLRLLLPCLSYPIDTFRWIQFHLHFSSRNFPLLFWSSLWRIP